MTTHIHTTAGYVPANSPFLSASMIGPPANVSTSEVPEEEKKKRKRKSKMAKYSVINVDQGSRWGQSAIKIDVEASSPKVALKKAFWKWKQYIGKYDGKFEEHQKDFVKYLVENLAKQDKGLWTVEGDEPSLYIVVKK